MIPYIDTAQGEYCLRKADRCDGCVSTKRQAYAGRQRIGSFRRKEDSRVIFAVERDSMLARQTRVWTLQGIRVSRNRARLHSLKLRVMQSIRFLKARNAESLPSY
jgi:hypothetical protein